MKYLTLILTLLITSLNSYSQNADKYVCRFGFTFEMSQQRSWGFNKPVVLSVTPLSPADASGLKVNDIVETINGVATHNLMSQDISNMLLESVKNEIKLTVSNIEYKNKEVIVQKDCKLANAINEEQLAGAYSFYSLENSHKRSFVCPFKTTVNEEIDLISYSTFAFSPVDEANAEIENNINQQIKNALEKIGMHFNNQNPDLMVNTYYSYNKNLNYSRSENADKLPIESRYNMNTRKMENVPIYYNPLINQRQAEYLLNLGIRFIDRKRTTKDHLFVVWECEADELLRSNYGLEEYAQFHVPLMLMQFPHPKTSETAQFEYSKLKYNYTGLSYNMDNLKQVADVDRMSPAYRAKIEPGDEVEKVNGIKINKDAKSSSEIYKQFIYQTMPLRDTHTQFTNSEGFTKCMYWDKFKYPMVVDAFKNPEYSAGFSYLFFFEPFINLAGSNIITFEIKRGSVKTDIKITPTIVTVESFETF